MDIHHLRVFASVFRHRSFSKAAAELQLSQPTVSDHIRALEKELRCRLFDRLPRSIVPTREAEALISSACEIIEKVDGVKNTLREFKRDLSGHLVIGASTIPGTFILPCSAAAFRRKYEAVLIEIVVSDSAGIVKRIASHELMLGIVGAKQDAHNLQFEPFLDDELIVAAAASFQPDGAMSPEDLMTIPFVMREKGSGTRKVFEGILEKKGFAPGKLNVAGIFGSTDAVKQAVKDGMGVSIVSRRSVKDELKCGILKEIPLKGLSMKREFYIVTHRRRTLPHLYKTFVSFIRSAK